MKQGKNLDELKQGVLECDTIAELCRKLELQPKGGNYNTVKTIIEENGLDISHFKGKQSIKRKKGIPKIKLSDVLEGKVKYGNSNSLKERLIKEGLKEGRCDCCKNTQGLDLDIPLELHHKNGNHYDNRLENLELLCPNCHACTDSYKGRNVNKDSSKIIKDVQESIRILKEKEQLRAEEIKNNNIKNGKIPNPNVVHKVKEIKYCLQCGKQIKGKGEKYCSYECSRKVQMKNDIYDPNTLLEQSKTVSSLIQLAKLYNITDRGLKKHLIKFGIFDQIKENFQSSTKIILQYDLNNNYIQEGTSASDAAKQYNISKSKILANCRGEQKTSGGFIGRYKE